MVTTSFATNKQVAAVVMVTVFPDSLAPVGAAESEEVGPPAQLPERVPPPVSWGLPVKFGLPENVGLPVKVPARVPPELVTRAPTVSVWVALFQVKFPEPASAPLELYWTWVFDPPMVRAEPKATLSWVYCSVPVAQFDPPNEVSTNLYCTPWVKKMDARPAESRMTGLVFETPPVESVKLACGVVVPAA